MHTIKPKGWNEFQHYKDRKPTWIKLHRDLLDNYDFHLLPVASKALAPCLWLLASEYDDGEIPDDLSLIAFRLRMSSSDVLEALTPLIDKGFFIASNSLADCKQDACLETERETEIETEKERSPEGDSLDGRPSKPKAKSGKSGIQTWLADCKAKGADPIPEDDAIYAWADSVQLPDDYLALAWDVFKRDMTDKGKLQTDWRATFRNYVRKGYLKLWAIGPDGYFLTTVGKQEAMAHGQS